MGDFLRTWLLGIVAAGMALSALYALLPKGRMATVGRGIGGLLLLLVILRPLTDWDGADFAVSYGDCRTQIEALTEEYRQDTTETLTALIEEKTAAYITAKGDALGVPCTAQVTAELRDGVPYPAQATMDTPYHSALSRWMADELDIDETHQHWTEEVTG